MTNGIRALNLSKEPKMSKRQEIDFGSAGEDEFFEDLNSPTDNSEDSVEVKVTPISSRNKRKCTEPRKVFEKFTGPLKKRVCLKIQSEKLSGNSECTTPFRPWSPKITESKKEVTDSVKTEIDTENDIEVLNSVVTQPVGFNVSHPHVIPALHQHSYSFPSSSEISTRMPSSYFRPPSPENYQQDEPVALIKKCQKTDIVKNEDVKISVPCTSSTNIDIPRVPVHPLASTMTPNETERLIMSSNEAFPTLNRPSSCSSKREQRNYKNMTRERRIEANARERTRVHTISAAFDTLRKAIPSYSHNQKLSKLSVLRIACSYIMTLTNIVNDDDPSKTAESVELITKTIQREGKLRKKKDDND